MTKSAPLRLLASGCIVVGICICGWLAFTIGARADYSYFIYMIEDHEAGQSLY